MSIKIIFFDIDGTLVDMKTKVMTKRIIDTLNILKDKGIIICIATGRSPTQLAHFDGIEFSAYLTFNGSYCFTDDGKTILSEAIPKDDVDRIIKNATKIGRPLSIATDKITVSNGQDEDLVEYYAFAKGMPYIGEEFDDIAKNNDVYQIMMGLTKDQYTDLLEGVKNARITAWWDRAVDIIPTNSGKGRGIKKMLAYYGFKKEEAMAFGDGRNDIEMLEAVGHGIAMANATDDVKAIADDICGDVADDGVYHYLKDKGII